jgi:hypothetical protein
MGKQSSTKKVQRAARAGGGRKVSRRERSMLWPGLISVIVIVGVALIVVSRDSTAYVRPGLFAEHPEDHWHMAFGINICGEYRGDLPEFVNSGIHTHGDGLIHVEATNSAETGDNATVGKFIGDYGNGFRVTDSELRLPGGDDFKESDDKCGGERAQVAAYVWDDRDDTEPDVVTEGIDDIRIRDHELIAFSFNPPGAELEEPPSASNLSDPNAAEGGGTTGTTAVPQPLPSTTVAGSTDTTTPPTESTAPATTSP